jgi:hypothetical protein
MCRNSWHPLHDESNDEGPNPEHVEVVRMQARVHVPVANLIAIGQHAERLTCVLELLRLHTVYMTFCLSIANS